MYNDIPTKQNLISNMTVMYDNVLELGQWRAHEPGHSGIPELLTNETLT